MQITERPSFALIKLHNLKNNVKIIKNLISSNTDIIAVVKANAYGHGAKQITESLYNETIKYFAVASSEEAEELLNSNITILNFGKIYKKDVEIAKKFNYILSITSFDSFNYFSENDSIEFHLNVDTGMGRCGIFFEDLPFLLEKLKIYKNLKFTGVYSHFPAADKDKNFTEKQITIFKKVKNFFIENGFKNLKYHISNSDGIINFPEANFDFVRPGIMLYGAYWDKVKKLELGLKPVMELKSKIIDIKTFKKGDSIGYKREFIVPFNNFKAGLVPIGYADGYLRALSGKSKALIKGKICDILGLVSMDWIIVDLNNVNVEIGDDIILFGDDEYKIDVDELADISGTISYEILCRIGERVKRIYKNDKYD